MPKFPFYLMICIAAAAMLYAFSSCKNHEQKDAGTETVTEDNNKNPKGYNLGKPEIFKMPDELHEISGIAFNKANSDTIYAEQDEEGKLFYFTPGSKNISSTKFGKHGDYEDVAISNGQVIMLRSDGVLFTFPLAEAVYKKTTDTKEWDDLLPAGEYEGLSLGLDGQLVALCKNCSADDQEKEVSVYILRQDANNQLSQLKSFKIEVGSIHLTSEKKHVKFHPSCLAQHPLTREWYIISSVNKELLIFDENWKVKASYALDAALFNQPEGLAFDAKGNMYISNEGGDMGKGTILKFVYKK